MVTVSSQIIKIWSLVSGLAIASLCLKDINATKAIDINFENTLLAVGTNNGILIFDLRNGELKVPVLRISKPPPKPISCLKFSPLCIDDDRYLAGGMENGIVFIWIWSLNTQKFRNAPIQFNEKSSIKTSIFKFQFSPGGSLLIALISDGTICIYDLRKLEKIFELEAKYEPKNNSERILEVICDNYTGIRLLAFCASCDPFIIYLNESYCATADISLRK